MLVYLGELRGMFPFTSCYNEFGRTQAAKPAPSRLALPKVFGLVPYAPQGALFFCGEGPRYRFSDRRGAACGDDDLCFSSCNNEDASGAVGRYSALAGLTGAQLGIWGSAFELV